MKTTAPSVRSLAQPPWRGYLVVGLLAMLLIGGLAVTQIRDGASPLSVGAAGIPKPTRTPRGPWCHIEGPVLRAIPPPLRADAARTARGVRISWAVSADYENCYVLRAVARVDGETIEREAHVDVRSQGRLSILDTYEWPSGTVVRYRLFRANEDGRGVAARLILVVP